MNDLALRAVSRAEILELEGLMVALANSGLPGAAAGCTDAIAPVTHHFAPGLYARELFMPAGMRLVGKLHRTSHIATVAKGSGIIWNEFEAFEYRAPFTRVTRAGAKNVIWAREDTVLITYHPTSACTLEDIEAEVIASSYADLETCRSIK